MNLSSNTELTSTERLLRCLGPAIDEAKLVRSIIKSRDFARNLAKDKPLFDRLQFVNQENDYLESELARVGTMAYQDSHD